MAVSNLVGFRFAGVQSWCSKSWQWLLQYKIVSRVFKHQPVEQEQSQQPPLFDSSERDNAETSVEQDTLEVGGAPG